MEDHCFLSQYFTGIKPSDTSKQSNTEQLKTLWKPTMAVIFSGDYISIQVQKAPHDSPYQYEPETTLVTQLRYVS